MDEQKKPHDFGQSFEWGSAPYYIKTPPQPVQRIAPNTLGWVYPPPRKADDDRLREFLARAYGKLPEAVPGTGSTPPPRVRRDATEPLVTRDVAAYLNDWFSKEPA